MAGFLFHEVVFGPVRSRRLGLSLGINLSPVHEKYCSFNCIYCECGWSPKEEKHPELPSREEVRWMLEKQLIELQKEDYLPDAITFAGNGEPTLHPDFPAIVEDTLSLRDQLAPHAVVAVLTNGTMNHHRPVFDALLRIDKNIQKLDAGTQPMFERLNQPMTPYALSDAVKTLQQFQGAVIIQSMFLRGRLGKGFIDNTLDAEVDAWLKQLAIIRPESVMLYSVARATPAKHLEQVSTEELEQIAHRVRALNIPAEVYP